MAIIRGKSIVTDGLVLHIDAANPKSYPGTGTTINDLSGNGNNGTLINGAAFNSANAGSIEFDGVNDTINFGTGNTFFPLENFTMIMWFSSDGQTDTTGAAPSLLGLTYGIRLRVNADNLSYGLDDGTTIRYLQSPSTYDFHNSSWHQVAIQANPTQRHMYIDGQYINSLTRNWSGTTRWPTNPANLGRDNNNSVYYFRGQIPIYKIYNKVLSAAEVLQNYNATKARFGL